METLQLPHRMAFRYDLHTKQRAEYSGQRASSQLTSIKYKTSSGFDPLRPSKIGTDVEMWYANLLELLHKIWIYGLLSATLYYLIVHYHLFKLKEQETKCLNIEFSFFWHFQVTYSSELNKRVMLSDPFFSSSHKNITSSPCGGGRRVTRLGRRHTPSQRRSQEANTGPRVWSECLPTLEWGNMQGSGTRAWLSIMRNFQVEEVLGIIWYLRHGLGKMQKAGSNAKERGSGNQAGKIKVYGQPNGLWIEGGENLRKRKDTKTNRLTLSLITISCSWILLRFYLQSLNE